MRDQADAKLAAAASAESYYGIPPIKAPHWRWLVICYFFLAGLTSTTFIVASLGDLVSRDRALVRVARHLSLATLLPCPVLLTLDLGRPERALHMFRILKLRSPMSLGSWALLGFGLFNGAIGAAQWLGDRHDRPYLAAARRVLGLVGLPFALFLTGYTGVLLAATNIPLWGRNYRLLGPTFVASAFSSGLAAISLTLGVAQREDPITARGLARSEVICLTAELGLLAAGVRHLGPLGRPLTAGRLGWVFWPGVVVGGLIVPLLLRLVGPGRSGGSRPGHAAAVLALLGSFLLRTLIIFAGAESARRPADYFAYTRRPGGLPGPT